MSWSVTLDESTNDYYHVNARSNIEEPVEISLFIQWKDDSKTPDECQNIKTNTDTDYVQVSEPSWKNGKVYSVKITPYDKKTNKVPNISITITGNVYNVSGIAENYTQTIKVDIPHTLYTQQTENIVKAIDVHTIEQTPEAMKDFFDAIYVPECEDGSDLDWTYKDNDYLNDVDFSFDYTPPTDIPEHVDVVIEEFTEGFKDGNGLYEVLMRVAADHLRDEHKAGRISGKEYAQVYVGMMQAAMQQSAQYVLQKAQTESQVALANIQAFQTNEQLKLSVAQSKLQAEISRIQAIGANEQLKLGVIQAKNQAYLAISQHKQSCLANKQLAYKLFAQEPITTGILEEKRENENAQHSSTLLNGVTSIDGLLGKEIAIKEAQKASFEDNSRIQAAKLYSDMLAVVFSTDPATVDLSSAGFGNSAIKNVMSTLYQNLGLEAEEDLYPPEN